MNYAIRLLMKEGERLKIAISNQEELFLDMPFENSFEEEMMKNCIDNLKHDLKQLVDAIEILRK